MQYVFILFGFVFSLRNLSGQHWEDLDMGRAPWQLTNKGMND